jgi:kynureninase
VPEITSREDALRADSTDPLAALRERFVLPEVTYLDGNSLGALPAGVAERVADAVNRQWGADLITSWNANGWWELPARLGTRLGALVGAAPGQVLCGDSTSIQLFQALTALARLRPDRRTLVTDGAGFPTDQYLADSVARMLGLTVVRVSPNEVRTVLDDDVAIVAFSAVDYRTGERWDAEAITAAAHAAGALMSWDLCHAAGCMPFDLDGLGADAAVGCTYKYLNGGPGAPAFAFVAAALQDQLAQPIQGWMGAADPFAMGPHYEPATGIRRFISGTPPIVGMLPMRDMLALIDRAGMPALRQKSLALTDFALEFADERLVPLGVRIASPREHARRGSHIMLEHPAFRELVDQLWQRGVIPDFRPPQGLRIGLSPLSTSFAELAAGLELTEQLLAAPRAAR